MKQDSARKATRCSRSSCNRPSGHAGRSGANRSSRYPQGASACSSGTTIWVSVERPSARAIQRPSCSPATATMVPSLRRRAALASIGWRFNANASVCSKFERSRCARMLSAALTAINSAIATRWSRTNDARSGSRPKKIPASIALTASDARPKASRLRVSSRRAIIGRRLAHRVAQLLLAAGSAPWQRCHSPSPAAIRRRPHRDDRRAWPAPATGRPAARPASRRACC